MRTNCHKKQFAVQLSDNSPHLANHWSRLLSKTLVNYVPLLSPGDSYSEVLSSHQNKGLFSPAPSNSQKPHCNFALSTFTGTGSAALPEGGGGAQCAGVHALWGRGYSDPRQPGSCISFAGVTQLLLVPSELQVPGASATSGREGWFVNELEEAAVRPTRFQNKEMKGGGGTGGVCGSRRRRRRRGGGGGGGGGGYCGRRGVPC